MSGVEIIKKIEAYLGKTLSDEEAKEKWDKLTEGQKALSRECFYKLGINKQ